MMARILTGIYLSACLAACGSDGPPVDIEGTWEVTWDVEMDRCGNTPGHDDWPARIGATDWEVTWDGEQYELMGDLLDISPAVSDDGRAFGAMVEATPPGWQIPATMTLVIDFVAAGDIVAATLTYRVDVDGYGLGGMPVCERRATLSGVRR